MAVVSFTAYSPTAFTLLSGSGFSVGDRYHVDADLDAGAQTYTIDVTDDDAFFSGDFWTGGAPDDNGQVASVYDSNGTLVDSGEIYLESGSRVIDEFGNTITVYRIEIENRLVGFVADGPLQPGNTYTVDSRINPSETSVRFDELVDVVYDQDVSNTIQGTSDNDTIEGGAGNDTIQTGDGIDVVYGGTGDDVIGGWLGGNGDKSYYGEEGNDSIIGQFNNDLISGGDGNDTLSGGAGFDTILGGDGADTFLITDDHQYDSIDGGTDHDIVTHANWISSSGVTVTFSGDEAGSYSYDGVGADAWGDFSEIEHIVGTTNDDFVDASLSNVYQKLEGGDGADTLTGGAGSDEILGDAGGDSLIGGAGQDYIDGGTGDDILSGGSGSDTLYGGLGGGLDTLSGDAGDDDLVMGSGDIAYGGDGDDEFFLYDSGGMGGTATIIGGEGNEGNADPTNQSGGDILRLNWDGTGSFVTDNYTIIASGNGAGSVTGSDTDVTFSEIEWINTGLGADTVDFSAATEGIFLLTDDGNDVITGSDGSDGVDAGAGDDTLAGGQGADTLYGGDDTDTFLIENSFGADSIVGGEVGTDADLIDLSAVTVSVNVVYSDTELGTITDGTDTLSFSEIERFVTTDQADTFTATTDPAVVSSIDLSAGDGDDTIRTASGDDTIDAGTGADLVSGGSGNDSIVGGAGNDTLSGGAGDDVMGGFSANEAGDDYLDGGFGNDTFAGGDGNDTLVGGTGEDWMFGNADADLFIIEDYIAADTVTGGETGTDLDRLDVSAVAIGVEVTLSGAEAGTLTDGFDTLNFSEIEAFTLTDFADSLDNSAQSSAVNADGRGGDDTLTAGAGDDTLLGGDGNDSLRGWNGSDSLVGGAGDDTITSDAGTDTVIGGAGNDSIGLWTGDDSVDAGDDADVIEAYQIDNDTIVGGEGGVDDDVLKTFVSSSVTVTYSGNEAGTITDGSGTLSFSEIERLVLSNFNDSLNGGSDSIGINAEGRDGNDVMSGGSGNDTFLGGTGADTISGGSGDDYIDGGDGDDLLTTGEGQDTLIGGGGNDTLMNSAGNDSLVGGAGDDSIVATLGNDTLEGGDGNDTLEGGADDDSLTGGDGDDVFVYNAGDGNDTITDFNFGNSGTLGDGDSTNNDFIDLSAFYDDIWELHGDYADDNILNQSNTTDINGNAVDYSDNTAMNGSITFTDASADSSSFTNENTGVVCFASGTAIRTPQGDRLIDTLRVGDLVTTMDNGPQPIRWIGRRHLDSCSLLMHPNLRPIFISKGVLGAARDLLVSPQHGMLLGDHLVRAKHLVAAPKSRVRIAHGRKSVTYIHLMFDAHQFVFAEKIPSESFYPGTMAQKMLDPAALAELWALFPGLCVAPNGSQATLQSYGDTVRPFCAKKTVAERFPSIGSVRL